ncbi:nuclear transport factor 2 family protein [Pseudonocardia hispaniensis]|uniref:Nuclear transport factor 2 family protein n=1 Tax=Pseudonocardia hispaniensis TaxID=904933 RepID=A0ABW1IWJ5_9PSEU
MSTETLTRAESAVRGYLAAWNATELADRRAAIAAAFGTDARYVDPLADVTGHDGLDALIAGVHQQFPGMVFSLVGDVDAHHDVLRFRWGLGPDGAEPLVIGFDVARIDDEGRITGVQGFLDRVPGGA